MRNIIDGLYVGTAYECPDADQDWAVVHACKHPCYVKVMGTSRVSKEHVNYLDFRREDHLYLNMIDPQVPLFMMGTFDAFLTFMDEMWTRDKKVLIHCNMGMSRSPSLALVFLSKRLKAITDVSYMEAMHQYREIDPDYFPSNGIRIWLTQNWDKII